MTTLTAADYADTGQWRLIVRIFTDGVTAHLENTLHDDVEPQELFSTHWEKGGSSLLQLIENAVYDHPRVLDDFSARIVVYDPRTLFMPTELLVDTEGAEEGYYTAVYESEPSDVMCESDKDVTAAFTMTPGLKGFLNRTFPGARISCHLMVALQKHRRTESGLRMVIDNRINEADFILLDDDRLLSASTHPLSADSDIAYHAFNIMEVYGLKPADVRIIAEGKLVNDEVRMTFEKFTLAV